MDIAYSREAMHNLLALDAASREKAISAAEGLAVEGPAGDVAFKRLLPVAEDSDFRLAPFSESGDLVVTRETDKLVVYALIDVIGALKEATEQ